MNFHEFYTKTENRLVDAILSLWATGDKKMQDYFKFLLTQEPVMADAIFQNTFPWEEGSTTFGQASDVFSQEFINALDAIKNPEYQFPKDRKPYKHQLRSWDALLNQKKSIAVTTGTGSGKTECFMLPVLQDIHENCKNQQGINAIFLYPLNALIASQQKRMHAWSSSLDGIKYGLLTGDTPNKANQSDKNVALPQLISREQIRETPPQILFTNPTMLEYMLVRNADVPIVDKSKGTLRWILLDEAHTLTGSKAAEMALLIRRVVAAFETDIKDIRFAITSATVGSGNTDILKNFMSNLCGISLSQIAVIEGRRVNDKILDQDIPSLSDVLSKKKIGFLRNEVLNSAGLSQAEIGKSLGISEKVEQLKAIDTIADTRVDGENLLPIRGHFFTRGIGGVYVCTNPKCDKHKDSKPEKALGTMYTIAGKKCDCGHPLIELVACRSCGNMMLEAERRKDSKGKNKVFQIASTGYEAFHLDSEEESSSENLNPDVVRFIRNYNNTPPRNGALFYCSINADNDIISGDDFLMTDDATCPHCASQSVSPIHFRISSAFTNRILSDIVLDQTNRDKDSVKKLYKGRKYISFTDSRQGTAKISALINIDSESDWIRYHTYHYLLQNYLSKKVNASLDELVQARALYVKQLDEALPFMRKNIQEQIDQINSAINSDAKGSLNNSRATWKSIIDEIKPKDGFKTLFKKAANGKDFISDSESYAKALMFDQFARRLPRQRSLENLGLVNMVYPDLDNVMLPKIAESLEISLDEWKDLLKISMDFVVRSGYHFQLDPSILNFTTRHLGSYPIYPTNSKLENVKKWPEYNPRSITQSRLVLLICAGLGWHERVDITSEREDKINDVLQKIWRTIQSKVLTLDGEGYKLDFFKNTQFEIAGKEYLCPVTNRLLDKVFRGYSPWIKGNLTEENIRYYMIDGDKTFQFPTYTHPFHLSVENELIDSREVERWLEHNSAAARDKGLWNDLHERIFDFEKLYLAGEHSAQQSKKRLQELELQFENGEINILSCSTTMEMGVDIGGISAVVMSNVPPMPANYLQRTGRAGRRAENKSLALTFCAPNPIGLRTMKNPKWALEHEIAPPSLAFDSKNIIARHVNSHMFGVFVRHSDNDQQGLNIKESIDNFFLAGTPTIAEKFLSWLDKIDSSYFEEQLKYLVKETPLGNESAESLVARVSTNFKKVVTNVIKQKAGFENKLQELKEEFGENSPAYKAVNFRQGQFLQKNVLNFLPEADFLPNAGLPTGIVDFEKTTIKDLRQQRGDKFKTNPSYPISRALTEFAPGNNILIDGLNYKSAGIVMKNTWGDTSVRTTIQGCKICGFQRTVDFGKVDEKCPKCNSENSFVGIELDEHKSSYTELVEPVGFSIDLFHTPTRVISERSRPQYLEPLLLNIEPWHQEQNGYIDYRNSSRDENTEILFYNTGDGDGYSLCMDCGRVETTHEKLQGHKRLRGGKDSDGESICSANNVRDHVILGSKFNTDFTEIRLKTASNAFVNNKRLIYSLGVIFTKVLADHLGVEESELGFGIKRYKTYQTIFIYDTAKGGAGYASQFRIYTKEILAQALKDLENCNCTAACTKCLVDRTTQWHIEDLDRHVALEWLRLANASQLPDDLQSENDNISVVIGSLSDEIDRLNYHYGIKEINLHVNNLISGWDIDELHWFEKLKRDGIEINLIVEGDVEYKSNQEKLSLYLLSHNYNLKIGKEHSFHAYPLKVSVRLSNDKGVGYISKDEYSGFNANTLSSGTSKFYRIDDLPILDYNSLPNPQIDSGNLHEARIQTIPRGSKSNALAGMMVRNLNNPQDLISKIKNKKFKVSYFDKYNQSEFSMRLMLQFVNQLKELWTIEVTDFNVHLEKDAFRSHYYPEYIIHNYKYYQDYVDALDELGNSFNFSINILDEKRLPHFRYFQFKADEFSFIIRIDGGIAHGFKPVERLNSQDMSAGNQIFEIRKDVSYDVIYNITINN